MLFEVGTGGSKCEVVLSIRVSICNMPWGAGVALLVVDVCHLVEMACVPS